MPLRITCPSCKASFSVADEKRGAKLLCIDCGKTLFIPVVNRDGSTLKEGIVERKQMAPPPLPPKMAPLQTKRVEKEVEEDEEEESPRSRRRLQQKAGLPMGLLIGGGAGLLGLVIVVGLIVLLKGGREAEAKAPVPVAQNNQPIQPVALPPSKEEPKQMAKVNPGPQKEELPPPAPPPPKVDPPMVLANLPMNGPLDGEKIYNRLLQSTVWIIAPQKPTGGFLAKIPPLVPPPTPPPLPKLPKGNALGVLTGTEWAGTETLPGFGALRFRFTSPTQVVMVDAKDTLLGRYTRTTTQITLTFDGNVVYRGAIVNGTTMNGTATNGKTNWTWTVTRGAEVAMPPTPGQGLQPSLGPRAVATGTGSLVDAKHRLVLTNCHVVGNPEELTLYFPEHQEGSLVVTREDYRKKPGIKGTVVLREDRCDIALVQLDSLPSTSQVLPLSATSANPAQQVHSLGNPGAAGALWNYSPGRVRQVFPDKWQVFDGNEKKVHSYQGWVLQTDSPLNPGDSGGPLVNDRCSLIGVAHAINTQAQNISTFIDVRECRDLLQRYYQSKGENWVPPASP